MVFSSHHPIFSMLFAGALTAQTDWSQPNPTTSPPEHSDHVLVGTAANVVLFGGNGPGGAIRDETWVWDGGNWSQRMPAVSPPARVRHAAAFDVARSQLVLFGGTDTNGTLLADTWVWNGSSWAQLNPATSPPARDDHAMTYDWARGRVLLFGGEAGSTMLDDTWEFDGANWVQASPPTVPPARRDHGLIYDVHRGRAVMFGGFPSAGIFTPLDDTWEWNGADWTQMRILNPGPRGGFGLTYDEFRQRTVLSSGWGPGNIRETWEYDGAAWTLRTTGSAPTARSGHATAWHAARQVLVQFGGYDNMFTNDTWTYTTTQPASWSRFGSGCAGTTGIPTVQGASLPWVGGSFQLDIGNLPAATTQVIVLLGFSNTNWNGLSLPLPLDALGLTGCSLLVAPDLVSAVPAQAGLASWTVPIPANRFLGGRHFYNQAVVPDLGANPANLIVSPGGDGLFGRR